MTESNKKEISEAQKKEIQMLLKDFIGQYPSQAKAVNALKGVSEATIIHIKRGEWESISDDMWRNIGSQVGFKKTKWQLIETGASRTLIDFFDDAREYSNVFAITADAGSGKSYTSEWYANKKDNVYVVSCSEYFTRKDFLQQILRSMGKSHEGHNVSEMMELIMETSRKKESPLIIFDEFDKVSDSVLYFFITFYNRLEGDLGMVIMATDFLAKRINRGVRNSKKGYKELFSRIGRRFISLPPITQKEVFEICKANGVSDPQDLHSIYNECEGDLRRVKRGIHKSLLKQAKKKG
jgi:hypothetical protein